MPDSCTCGAVLPPDARFCHRCGKPQYEDPRLEAEEEPERPVAQPPEEPVAVLPISFKNPQAVRTGFFTAILVWLLIVLPVGGALGMVLKVVMLGAGGFLAVILYTRRTGELLTIGSGARLGWITGVLFYAIWMIFFTITMLLLQQEGGLMEAYRKQLEQSNAPAQTIDQLTQVMQSPGVFGAAIVMMLFLMFFVFTLPMIAGGALAAKVLERNQSAA